MKKLPALLLSLLLSLSLAVPAMANVTININGVALYGVVRQTGKTLSIVEYDDNGVPSVVEKTVTVYYFPDSGGRISLENSDLVPSLLTFTLTDGIYTMTDGDCISQPWEVTKEAWDTPDMLYEIVADGINDIFFTFDSNSEELSPSSSSFTDVAVNAWYAEPVTWAVEKGITTGTTDTTFSPNSTCTTAQILTFLWRAQGSPAPAGGNPFTDVAVNAWYADAAVWAYENGLVIGDTFNGSAPCTRSATVTYLWTLAGKPFTGSTAFTDVAENAAYAQAVAWAVEEEITSGVTDTTFAPDSTCTRGQIVTFLYRGLAD